MTPASSGFEFDRPTNTGTNRASTGCPACDGHGLVQVVDAEDPDREIYARCYACNGGTEREPVPSSRADRIVP